MHPPQLKLYLVLWCSSQDHARTPPSRLQVMCLCRTTYSLGVKTSEVMTEKKHLFIFAFGSICVDYWDDAPLVCSCAHLFTHIQFWASVCVFMCAVGVSYHQLPFSSVVLSNQ